MIDFSQLEKINEEVYHSNLDYFFLDNLDIKSLLHLSEKNTRKRARVCSHKNSNEIVQEMFIIHPKDAYVRPHKHINKIESMLILEGEVDFYLFDDNGKIEKKIEMGDYHSGKIFYDSMRTEKYHSLNIKSDWLVFMEITMGPFKKEDTIFAPWSPEDNNLDEVRLFMKENFKVE